MMIGTLAFLKVSLFTLGCVLLIIIFIYFFSTDDYN